MVAENMQVGEHVDIHRLGRGEIKKFIGAVGDINAIRMRTQEGFPNFGEVDDLMNFEQIQVGLQAEEDEWAYTHRGLGLPDRFSVDDAGTIKGPATDEVFLREYFKEYRRLMTTEPNIQIAREV